MRSLLKITLWCAQIGSPETDYEGALFAVCVCELMFYIIIVINAFEKAQLNKSKSIFQLLCSITSCLLKHAFSFYLHYLCVCVYLCEYMNALPEGLSWLQFNRVGFAPCLRSWLTMLVCKRWEKYPHQSFLFNCTFSQYTNMSTEKHVIADF